MPDLGALTGPIDVQLIKTSGGVCWGATLQRAVPEERRDDLQRQGGLT